MHSKFSSSNARKFAKLTPKNEGDTEIPRPEDEDEEEPRPERRRRPGIIRRLIGRGARAAARGIRRRRARRA